MLAFCFATFMYFMIGSAGGSVSAAGYLQAVGFSILCLVALVAVMSIPVVVYCYFVKMIPDIDYSIRAAFAFTIIGIISEIVF